LCPQHNHRQPRGHPALTTRQSPSPAFRTIATFTSSCGSGLGVREPTGPQLLQSRSYLNGCNGILQCLEPLRFSTKQTAVPTCTYSLADIGRYGWRLTIAHNQTLSLISAALHHNIPGSLLSAHWATAPTKPQLHLLAQLSSNSHTRQALAAHSQEQP
jgi:hypothetical protein